MCKILEQPSSWITFYKNITEQKDFHFDITKRLFAEKKFRKAVCKHLNQFIVFLSVQIPENVV